MIPYIHPKFVEALTSPASDTSAKAQICTQNFRRSVARQFFLFLRIGFGGANRDASSGRNRPFWLRCPAKKNSRHPERSEGPLYFAATLVRSFGLSFPYRSGGLCNARLTRISPSGVNKKR